MYETKDGKFYQKTNKYRIIIGSLIAAIVLLGAVLVGNSISSTRRYRAELEQ